MEVTTGFADARLEISGVWRPYRDGSRVKVARMGNLNFNRRMEELREPYKFVNGAGIGAEKETDILCQAMSETILLDWDGFTKGGKPLKYSQGEAYGLLRRSMDFRNDIARMAALEQNFHSVAAGEQEKN